MCLVQKGCKCSYDRQHRQNPVSCRQAFMWIALRIQTGSKSNNCPIYTAAQYIEVRLQKHLGSHWVQNTRWWMKLDEWTKLWSAYEVKTNLNVRHWKRSSSASLELTSIPQNINPHYSQGIFLENTWGNPCWIGFLFPFHFQIYCD